MTSPSSEKPARPQTARPAFGLSQDVPAMLTSSPETQC